MGRVHFSKLIVHRERISLWDFLIDLKGEKMEIGKTYLVKKDIFGLKKDELWTLVDKGYQAYFGEHNFVFVNDEKVKVFAVLLDSSEEDIQIYDHLDDYLEEVAHENF